MTVAQPVYTHYIRDKDRNRVERLDTWSVYNIIKRFNKVGTWNLEIPTSSAMASFVNKDCGIIVQRDGQTIFSGQVGTDYIVTKDTIKMSGFDDNKLLADNDARPVPSQNTEPYADEYYVATGIASSILIDLVVRNIGVIAPSFWKITGLVTGTDPLIGSAVTVRARFDPLITLLQELASTSMATGLGFQILQDDDLSATLNFDVYQPQDRHLETIFSLDLHTMQDFEHRHQVPAANYFIVAGGDDFGANRTIVEDGDATSIAEVGRRISQFVDARGTTDVGELNQKLAELLATVITTDIITIVPTAVPSMIYGVNYDLGDYVTTVVEGVEYPMLVREVAINFDVLRGPLIIPTVADPNGSNDSIEAQHLATLEGRISNIERNYNVPDDSIIEDMLHPTMKWYPGDLKATARDSAQPGWLICDGTAINKTTYSRLYDAIGETYWDGIVHSTTFNIPDLRDTYPVGAGIDHVLGARAGSNDTTQHHHLGGTLKFVHVHIGGGTHTHPGAHGHDLPAHFHIVPIDHDHDDIVTGGATDPLFGDGDGVTHDNGGSAQTYANMNHIHPAASGTINLNVNSQQGIKSSGGGAFNRADNDSDTGTFAAVYTGDTGGINNDSWTGESGDVVGSINSEPANVAINWEIYTGIIP